jgi:hypothetical protein
MNRAQEGAQADAVAKSKRAFLREELSKRFTELVGSDY